MARVNKLLKMRQTIDYRLSKTINELTNQSSDSETFCPRERIKELKLRTQRRNNFEEELFKDMFPTVEELAYHKELPGEQHPPFSTLEPKIKRGDLWTLKIPCVIGTVYTGHAYIDLQSPVNIIVIDGRQSEVVLRKPFVQASKLTYDESLGLIRFAHRDDEVVFRMPQRTKELDLVSPLKKDKFEAFFVESLKARKKEFKHVLEKRKGYYKACMNLGRTYKRDRETLEKRKTNHVDRGDGVASKKRRHRDLSSDGVEDLTMTSGRNRLKSNLEDSTW
ncbi:hypothetical protein Tco_1080180 [Tanacetum coccineum]|uniref:Uncharacterized protein n=1 Tax=Tanacetum coccineum TaxID=301880 RepID=A0ABQ5HVI8_9ASTR